MEKNKKKMDELTKAKLIYTIELVVFSVVFLVIGILNILEIIYPKEWRASAVLYLTSIGGFIGIADFIWMLASKKRRAKGSLLDKALVVPATLFIAPLSIYQLANGITSFIPWQIGSGLCYLSLVYIIEAIYHWYHPIPGLLEEETKKVDLTKEPVIEENPSIQSEEVEEIKDEEKEAK